MTPTRARACGPEPADARSAAQGDQADLAAAGGVQGSARAAMIPPSTTTSTSGMSSSARRTEMADFSRYYPEGVPPLLNPAGWEVGEWGVGQVPGSQLHFIHIEHPMKNLTSLSELKEYPFPDLTRPERHAHLEAQVEGAARPGAVRHRLHGVDDLRDRLAHARDGQPLHGPGRSTRSSRTYLLEKITETRCFQAKRHRRGGRGPDQDRRRRRHAALDADEPGDVPRVVQAVPRGGDRGGARRSGPTSPSATTATATAGTSSPT